jgi:hypothetical protein
VILTNHFVFVHIPKTGGNFVQSVCERHLPSYWYVDVSLSSHTPSSRIPFEFTDLPRFALVRNPWDWYVSLYSYLRVSDDQPNLRRAKSPLWKLVTADGKRDFKTVVTRWCEGAFDHHYARQLRERKIDLFTLRYRSLVGTSVDEGTIDIGRFENLRSDFLGFFVRHDIPTPRALTEAVRNARATNVSERGLYSDYYDAELRELVGERARQIIERYDYEFEDQNRTSAAQSMTK